MTNKQREEAMNNATLEFLKMIVVGTEILEPQLKELNYWKIPVETEGGGKYLLSFTHVEGPKIPLNQKKDKADG